MLHELRDQAIKLEIKIDAQLFGEARVKERFPSERRQNPAPVRKSFVVSFPVLLYCRLL